MQNYPEKVNLCAEAVLEKKAEDVMVLDMRGLVGYTDYFIVCSGDSAVQIRAIADELMRGLKDKGCRPLHAEGYDDARWVLLDYGDLIVHVFLREVREFYELEKLWADAPCGRIEDKKQQGRGGGAG